MELHNTSLALECWLQSTQGKVFVLTLIASRTRSLLIDSGLVRIRSNIASRAMAFPPLILTIRGNRNLPDLHSRHCLRCSLLLPLSGYCDRYREHGRLVRRHHLPLDPPKALPASWLRVGHAYNRPALPHPFNICESPYPVEATSETRLKCMARFPHLQRSYLRSHDRWRFLH